MIVRAVNFQPWRPPTNLPLTYWGVCVVERDGAYLANAVVLQSSRETYAVWWDRYATPPMFVAQVVDDPR